MRLPRSSAYSALVAASTMSAALLGILGAGCENRSERTLTVSFDDAFLTLDPHLHNHSVTWSVLMNVYDGLVRFTPEMRLEPSLAASWEEVTPTRWRLHLREGVRFSDGDPLTAADVVASFERARDHPRSLVRHFLVGVRGMQAENAGTVLVDTDAPSPDLFNRLAFLLIAPRSAAGGDEIREPVGTGPYKLVARGDDGGLLLEGWESWRGKPEISRILMSFDDDENAAAARFLAGRVDVLRRIPDRLVAEIELRRSLRAIPQPRLSVQLIAVVPSSPGGSAGDALADPRVRRALLHALDREGWVDRICRGNAAVASQYVHPVVFGYDPALQPLPYDPDLARKLLAEAGYPGGFAVRVAHGNVSSEIVEAITDELKGVGVRATSVPGTFGEALEAARAGNVDLLLYGWVCSTADASDFLNSSLRTSDPARGLGAENISRLSDPVVDALLERADRQLVPSERLALLQQAQRRALESLPVLPLIIRWGFLGASSRVEVRARHDEVIWLFDYRWRR